MIHEQINLKDDGRVNVRTYVLDVYRRTQGMLRPAMVVLPGGGYGHISTSEGEPVALTFNRLGYNAFVLSYSVMEYSEYPNPVDELAATIKMIRERADEWQIDPDRIGIVGFSAGGSLAGIYATQWHNPELAARLGCDSEMLKPNVALVGYGPSDWKYMGGEVDPEAAAKVNATERGKILDDGTPEVGFVDYIDEKTAPMFIWHARQDELVDVENALSTASHMQAAGRPFELHIFDDGHHGQSVNNRISHPDDVDADWSIQQWVPLADHWVRRQFGMNE